MYMVNIIYDMNLRRDKQENVGKKYLYCITFYQLIWFSEEAAAAAACLVIESNLHSVV